MRSARIEVLVTRNETLEVGGIAEIAVRAQNQRCVPQTVYQMLRTNFFENDFLIVRTKHRWSSISD